MTQAINFLREHKTMIFLAVGGIGTFSFLNFVLESVTKGL